MSNSLRHIGYDLIRVCYELRSFAVLIYFISCYTLIANLDGVFQIGLSVVCIVVGFACMILYIKHVQSSIKTDIWKPLSSITILLSMTIIATYILYIDHSSQLLAFSSTITSSLGFIAVNKYTLPLKDTFIQLYPKRMKVYNETYPFYLHLIYALTHSQKNYEEFIVGERRNQIVFELSLKHNISVSSFRDQEEYIEWFESVESIPECEVCGETNCKGSDLEVKGSGCFDYNPVRTYICNNCKKSLTEKLIDSGQVDSETVTSILI